MRTPSADVGSDADDEPPLPGGRRRARVLGRVRGARPGPLLVALGGIHGNEPAGVRGLERVLATLEGRAGEMAGDFVALAGNLEALSRGRRYVDLDLNRTWTPERVAALEARPEGRGTAEDREQRELLDALEGAVAGARGRVSVVDLHTFSAPGGCFSTVSDTLENRSLALHLPVPLILGLEELVEGTLLSLLNQRGFTAMGFESGQHDEARAVDRAEAAVWIVVTALGLLPERAVPEVTASRKLLARDTRGLPRVLEMRHCHRLEEGDGFRMEPGYRNFQRVRSGEVLGHDHLGAVTAPESGRVLMPLYQEQGSDGFFLVREFRPFWLHVSVFLRRIRLQDVVHWLPGVERDPDRPDVLVVDRRVARWYALQLFHLLGFRRQWSEGDKLVVVKRTPGSGDG